MRSFGSVASYSLLGTQAPKLLSQQQDIDMGHIDSMQLGDFTHPAFSTVHSTMLAAKHLIDETFGQGFAQANPILLAAFMEASTRHLISELEAGIHHVRLEAVDTLSQKMGRIADALEPR